MTANILLGNYDCFRTCNAMQSVVQVMVANYWEAIGVIAAHKAGINPYSLRRNGIGNIKRAFAKPAKGVSSATQTTLLEMSGVH